MAAAPILDTSARPKFTAIVENSGVPSGAAGTLVSTLIDSGGSLNNFSDSDGDSPAIAITATNLAGGTLYFTTDGGSTWSDVGTVSDSSSRLLHADNNTRLAFVPAANYTGNISDLVTFKAWDRTGVEVISRNPTLTGTFETSDTADGITLSADGKTAFVADGKSGLQIIDVSNPASPTLTGTFYTSKRYAFSVAISADGKTAFIADYGYGKPIDGKPIGGLQIIDVSNPASPTLTGTFDTPGDATKLTLSADGKTAFVGDWIGGLQIIDVSNPANPTLTGNFDISEAQGVTLSADGKIAFVADEYSGLQIIDISNPASPTLTGTFDTSGSAHGVTLSVDGKTAFVADRHGGLQIIDVNNPANPTLTGNFDTPGYAFEITLSADGKTAFVADWSSGLQIIDVSNPASPTLTGTFDTSGSANEVTISADGRTAFVADRGNGLQIIDVTEPAQNGAHSVVTTSSLNGHQQPFSGKADTASINVLAATTLTPNSSQVPEPTPGEEVDFYKVKSIDNITTPDEVSTFELKKPIVIGEQKVKTLIVGTDKKDKITGSSDGEILAGGDGKDVLQGGDGADGFLFQDPEGFGKKEADKVKDFDPKEGDSVLIDKDVFYLGEKVDLKAVTGKKSSKNASNSREDFIYDDKKGFLYFNENGKEDGWGDGGLFVKLKGAPEIGASDLTIV